MTSGASGRASLCPTWSAGDDLFLNGDRRSGVFVARYINVNIGRADGRIVAMDGNALTLEVHGRAGGVSLVRAELSRYLRSDSLTLADVRVGDAIGAVVYYERDVSGQIAFRRITKMWRN